VVGATLHVGAPDWNPAVSWSGLPFEVAVTVAVAVVPASVARLRLPGETLNCGVGEPLTADAAAGTQATAAAVRRSAA
jgi:hypothetical protein